MRDINEMKGKRASLVVEAREILDLAGKENRGLTAEEQQKYDRIMADVDRMADEIRREERVKQLEAEMRNSPGPTNHPTPSASRETNPRASQEYQDAFWNAIRHGHNALEPQQYRLLQEVRNSLFVGTDTAGGFLVGESYETQLIQALEEENVMRTLAAVIRSSNDRNIPVVDSHGIAYWTGENDPFTESDETFGQKTLRAHKLTCLIKVSEELLQDSVFDLEGYIQNEFVRRIGAKEESAFVNGDGINKPKGIVVDAQVGVTAASATAITTDEIVDLYHSVKRPYRRKGTFMAQDATIKAIRKLKDADSQYIWQPGLQAGEPDRLLGQAIVASADMPAIATGNKSILFGDFSYYWISDRAGRVFQRLGELYAANGQVGFRAWQRVDGLLTLAEAVKALKQA
ncbi:MAG: phage major capsid protein [Clostridia bacterium]|nr:phage major capsid protein [Clostridia bacterium]